MASSDPKAGWYRDPTGRHDLRRWDGDGWSEWVMDGTRRHFDDIDGCGGPPRGDLVAVEGGRGGGRGARRRLRATGTPASTGAATSTHVPLPPGGPASMRGLNIALVTTVVASAAAWVVVSVIDDGVFESVTASFGHRLAGPYVLAALAFELVAATGLVVASRRGPSPLRPPTAISGEDALRGGIAFLLALFAWTFVASAGGGSSGGWLSARAAFDALLVVEVFVAVLAAPVVEERLFRGLLLVGLRQRFGPVLGVLGQAAITGAAVSWTAGAGGRTGAALGAFAVAAVFGWFTHATDDLKPAMLGHAILAAWTIIARFG